MCLVAAPPALFLTSPQQAPGLWLLLAVWMVASICQLAATNGYNLLPSRDYASSWVRRYYVAPGRKRLVAVGLLIVWSVGGAAGLCFLLTLWGAGDTAWHAALQQWYHQETRQLMSQGCVTMSLEALYAHALAQDDQLRRLALVAFMGGGLCEFVRGRLRVWWRPRTGESG